MNEITMIILKFVVSLGAALITIYAVPFLHNMTGYFKDKRVIEIVTTAVEAAEQTIKGSKQGALKKETVYNTVIAQLNSLGIKMTKEELSDLIESAVFGMNLGRRMNTYSVGREDKN